MDCTRSHSIPQIHVCLRCMEFWYRMLGGDVIRREAILELVQSGCYQEHRKGLQVFVFSKVHLMVCSDTALCFLLSLSYIEYLVNSRNVVDLKEYKVTWQNCFHCEIWDSHSDGYHLLSTLKTRGGRFLWNAGTHLPNYKVPYPRRPELWFLSYW